MNKKGMFFMLLSFLAMTTTCALDTQIWQGQYSTGTTLRQGTFEFNFTVYDALIGGTVCYYNVTDLITNTWGWWKTEQTGIAYVCNNSSVKYYLEIQIESLSQPPRRFLKHLTYPDLSIDNIFSANMEISGDLHMIGAITHNSPVVIREGIALVNDSDNTHITIYHADSDANNITDTHPLYNESAVFEVEDSNDPYTDFLFWDKADQKALLDLRNDVAIFGGGINVNGDSFFSDKVNIDGWLNVTGALIIGNQINGDYIISNDLRTKNLEISTSVEPFSNVDLGTSIKEFRRGYFDTDVLVDGISVCLESGVNCPIITPNSISGLNGTYSNGEAYVCVYDNGTIFVKDSACN